ncbi:hypothetical protein BG004_002456 [Podila humilis]|nr:hypothetical protein BG004_002456 [Podila humilis]
MSRLLSSTTPSFAQAAYTPLVDSSRHSQDQATTDGDEDDLDPDSSNQNTNTNTSRRSRNYSGSHRQSSSNHNTLSTSSTTSSSSTSTMKEHHHHTSSQTHKLSNDSDEEDEQAEVNNNPFNSTHYRSDEEDSATTILVHPSSPTSSSSSLSSSSPKKYARESFEYSEPGGHNTNSDRTNWPQRRGSDEETGGGQGAHYEADSDSEGHLWMQASSTLVIAVSGLICAGWLLDEVQHWPVFIEISELIILIPILLNLKGNLEMNLASRLSTAVDSPATRNAFIKGNLALLQLQSLTVGSVAGLFAFVLGMIVHPTTNDLSEIALMISSSMLCASVSSFLLGSFMCALVLICRHFRVNPDNIACPLASSFGDLVTLVILSGFSVLLAKFIETPLSEILLVVLLMLIPGWVYYVRSNKFVSEVVKEGWGPVFAAMVIASTAGLTLERYINQFPGMAMISPVLNGLTGNIGSIYASRISTALHANIEEAYRKTERTLFLVHIPIEIMFLAVVGILKLGDVQWSFAVVAGYALVSLTLVVIALTLAKHITRLFWKWGYDPDNYALPILTSLIDVLGTMLLVLGFWSLGYGQKAPVAPPQ